MDKINEHECAIVEAYAFDENFAGILLRFSRAQQKKGNLKDALSAYDEADVENYKSITENIDKVRKILNMLCARLHCVCDNHAYSSLPYSDIKNTLEDTCKQFEKLLHESVTPNIFHQSERYYLD